MDGRSAPLRSRVCKSPWSCAFSQTSSADSESSNGGRKSPSKGAARPLAPFGTDDISPFDEENDAFTTGKDKVNGSDPPVAFRHYISDISDFYFYFLNHPFSQHVIPLSLSKVNSFIHPFITFIFFVQFFVFPSCFF